MLDNNTLDEFRLSIAVEDNNSAEKVDALADAITRLQSVSKSLVGQTSGIKEIGKQVGSLDLSGLEDKSSRIVSKIGLLQKEFGLVSDKINEGKMNALQENKALQRQVAIAEQLSRLYKEIAKSSGASGVGTTTVDVETGEGTAPTKGKKADGSSKKLVASKEQAKAAKETAKAEKSSLLSSIKRVAVYRAIRAVLKTITESLSSSFKGIALQNEQFNKTMSNISSSVNKAGASVGVALYPALMAIDPLIQKISAGFVKFSNDLAITIAAITGQSKVMQINTDYWKDYKESIDEASGSLLAFDTFTTLQSGQSGGAGLFGDIDYEKMFQEVDLSSLDTSQINESLSNTFDILGKISIVLGTIGGAKIISGIGNLIGAFSKIKDITKLISPEMAMMAIGLTMLVMGIAEFIRNMDNANFETWEKWVVGLTAAVAALVVAIIAMKTAGNIAVGLAAAAAVAGVTLAVGSNLAVKTKPKTYANGGMFEGAGTMYAIAGENGAEVVAQGSSGTGVLNVQQFKDAMVMALYEYGAARGDLGDMQVSMNGTKVGQMVAKSSYNEMKRQGLL